MEEHATKEPELFPILTVGRHMGMDGRYMALPVRKRLKIIGEQRSADVNRRRRPGMNK